MVIPEVLHTHAQIKGHQQSRRNLGHQMEKVRQNVNGKEVWTKVIKARLTARGFKDLQAFSEDHQTYSGTASKWGQREINITAANPGHRLFPWIYRQHSSKE